MDQAAARKILMELVKREDLDNKKCIDCGNPNPQWASLRSALHLALHRLRSQFECVLSFS